MVVSRYVFSRHPQSFNLFEPGTLEYVPVGHEVQILAAVKLAYVSTLQSVHAALPVVFLYFPATHAVHGPASGPVNPMLHAQPVVFETLDHGEMVFAGHTVHEALNLLT